MKKKDKWSGPFVVSVTPFDKEGNIDISSFRKCIKYYLDVGVTGIIIGGHNGESWAIEEDEFPVLVENAVKVVEGKVPIIVGLVNVCPSQIIRIANACHAVGAQGLMVEPPYILTKTTNDEIVARFQTICDSIDMSVIVYNNPRRTQINLTADNVSILADIKNVVAIKEASSDFKHVSNLIQTCGDRISVMIGPGELIFPALLLGAKGFITSGAVEIMGKDGVRLYETAIAGNIAEALVLHRKMSALYNKLFEYGTWPAAMKAVMNIKGIPAGYTRSPVQPLKPEELEKLKADMKTLGVI